MIKNSTLYISDLDGTLLDSCGRLSPVSCEILNKLIENGLLFTVATARSAATCTQLLEKLNLRLPAVLMNGVFVYDLKNKKYIHSNFISEKSSAELIEVFRRFNKSPFQYTLFENSGIDVRYRTLETDVQRDFYNSRVGLTYKSFIQCSEYPIVPDVVYYVLIDLKNELLPVKEAAEKINGVRCAFYKDNYSDCWYLEIFSDKAGKSDGMDKIKALCGAQRTAAFGDNINDTEMLLSADEAYAVENAVSQIKSIALSTVPANTRDGVARFLMQKFCGDLLENGILR